MGVYAAPGYLLVQRNGTLFAQAFNAKSLTLTGEPFRVADQVLFSDANGRAAFAASQTGTLVYRAGGGSAETRRFMWFDKTGKEMGLAGEPGAYSGNFALSPDGKQLAVSMITNEAAPQTDLACGLRPVRLS